MSRIGKKPVPLPKGVTAKVEGQTVGEGAEGRAASCCRPRLGQDGGRRDPVGRARRPNGARAHVGHVAHADAERLMHGVTEGFEQSWRSPASAIAPQVQGKNLQPALGYSHEVNYPIPEGITIAVPKPTEIVDHRHRQAESRAGGRRNPRLPPAGALQGQGREIRRRVHLPQGRQEEVTGGDGDGQIRPRTAQGACVRAVSRRRRPAARGCRCSARRSTSTRR